MFKFNTSNMCGPIPLCLLKGKKVIAAVVGNKSRYNNRLIVKLMLMWRRDDRREMIGHGCIDSGRRK
jgi:hypothetical protein